MAIMVVGFLDFRACSFQPGAAFMGQIEMGLGWRERYAINRLLGSGDARDSLGAFDHQPYQTCFTKEIINGINLATYR